MSSDVLPAIGAIFAWLGWEILHELVGERIIKLLRLIVRPIWRAFVVARWPWPLVIVVPLGVAGVIKGYSLLSSPARRTAGLTLFFGGAGVSLLTLILWSETKREAAIARASTLRSERVRG